MKPMSRHVSVLLVLVFGILASLLAVAESGTCPPGYYPIGGDPVGWSSCAPIPDHDGDGARPTPIDSPSWKTQWIAIATGSGAYGVGKDLPSKREAESSAMRDCKSKGGENCTIYLQTYNQCIALAGGAHTLSVYTADTQDKSESLAMKKCGANPSNGQCEVYYSGCSYPLRVN